MPELMKKLLGIQGDAEDEVIAHYLEQAKIAACVYCNVSSLPERYNGTIVDLAVFLYRNKDHAELKSKTQGERSVTYFDAADIPENIKAALPLPRVRVMGDVL